MKIYFSEVLDLTDTDETFEYNDSYFYNYVEYGTNAGGLDEIAITDTCRRYMPISIEQVPDLITALQACYDIHMKVLKAKELEILAESDEAAHVEYHEVQFENESLQDSRW
jgi:hypothetical protein